MKTDTLYHLIICCIHIGCAYVETVLRICASRMCIVYVHRICPFGFDKSTKTLELNTGVRCLKTSLEVVLGVQNGFVLGLCRRKLGFGGSGIGSDLLIWVLCGPVVGAG